MYLNLNASLPGEAPSEESSADPMAAGADLVASPDVPSGGMLDQEWTNPEWTDKEWQDWTNRGWTDKEWQEWTMSFKSVEAGPLPHMPADTSREVGVILSSSVCHDLTVADR